ncbi:flavin-containing monooxygenase [Microbacterium xanthum]|uniref:flavin-containing monooxygenase n=1 Tax=Microbacterium xanthum TaxID=3079794 RepID=UPI002AD4DBFF|nr:NAD(P)/FAD-dependent oxidoreductase [Microbacterium sp. KSW-48]MDZ8172902.1 NAD(P)/FAD-dependent oxidoreductase [Microbacterium sp. KSW-48]
MTTRVEVAIIGAGFAGIGMALALLRDGRESFVLLERGNSVGGTWRDNTYPGVACDVPSHLYGFAGHPHPDWSRVFAPGAEIHRYLVDVADRTGVSARTRLHTAMTGAIWHADTATWRVTTSGGDTVVADALALACGRLTEPLIPEIAGLESFPGPLFHSARWDHAVEVTGRRIGVVGTGASAVQLVPELVRLGAHVTLFQRTPAWIVPRGERAYTAAERKRFAQHPETLAGLRATLYTEGEERFASRSGRDAAAADTARQAALDHLRAQVADPALRAALTPDYAFGCKRVLLSDTFYPAVASDAVSLVGTALQTVDGTTLTAADGSRHEVDALVLATGFASARQPYADLVVGEDGTLADHWSAGMTSYASTVVAGFPNLFVLNGPNASLGHNSSVLMLEEQAAYAVQALARRDRSAGGVLRVDPAAEAAYTAEIDDAAASTPWITGGCRNWYVDPRSGRLTLLWPGTVDAFRERLAGADGTEFLDPIPATPASTSTPPSYPFSGGTP